MEQFLVATIYGQLRIHKVNLLAITEGAVRNDYAGLIRSRAIIELTQIISELNTFREHQIILVEERSEKELGRITEVNKQLIRVSEGPVPEEMRPQIDAVVSRVMLSARQIPSALDAQERISIAKINRHIDPLIEKCTKFLHIFEKLKL